MKTYPVEYEKHEKPNVADPLSEATRHRRVWAAYLAAGYTRREFARALETNYHTVTRWDTGAAVMSLDMLERAVPLVRYSMDELCFGRNGAQAAPRQLPQRETALAEPEIRELFDRLHVAPTTRAAFGEHAASPAGRYQTFTRSYVEAWCSAYSSSDDIAALQAGVTARAQTEAVTAGVGAVAPEQLRAALRGSKP